MTEQDVHGHDDSRRKPYA